MIYKRVIAGLTSIVLTLGVLSVSAGDTLSDFFNNQSAIVYAETFDDFEYTTNGDTVTITKYIGEERNVAFPEEIDGKRVTGITTGNLFEYPEEITSIVIPSSVIIITPGAHYGYFFGCTDLMEIYVEEGNLFYSSEDGVLYNKNKSELICHPQGIEDAKISSETKEIGYGAFSNCYKLENINIPNGVTSISSYAFFYCEHLESISLPESIEHIGNDAFSSCSNLRSIAIPANAELEERVFLDCRGLQEVSIGNGINELPSEIFLGCSALSSITLPDSIQTIQMGAFQYCSSLKSINLPNNLTQIQDMAFTDTGLEKITFPNNPINIGWASFAGNENLTNVIFSNSETFVGESAFSECENLKSVIIPENVVEIGDYAFGYKSDPSTHDYVKVNGFKIFCYANSAAEEYAIRNNINYELLDDDYTYDNGEGTYFHYLAEDANGNEFNASAEYFYNDDYFSNSAFEYNPHLATMSLCLAMSSFASAGPSNGNQSSNVKELMHDIGINNEDIVNNRDFDEIPGIDTMGVIAGNKKIRVNDQEYTLIIVGLRGAGYDGEWAGNFNVGSSGQHTGFNTAKNEVIRFLRDDYIPSRGINGPVKIWISGFSRAAATANLVAGALDSGEFLSNNISYTSQDIYAYCFETPQGALSGVSTIPAMCGSQYLASANKLIYGNIFNIINKNDPVPYVAPSSLGFSRYGIDKYLPTQLSTVNYPDIKNVMLRHYPTYKGNYSVDSFQSKQIKWEPKIENGVFKIKPTIYNGNNTNQEVFLENFVWNVSANLIQSRDNYVNNYQEAIKTLMFTLKGTTEDQRERFTSFFLLSCIREVLDYSTIAIISQIPGLEVPAAVLNLINQQYRRNLADILRESFSVAGIEANYTDQQLSSVADLLLTALIFDTDNIVTLLSNTSGLGGAHYPELCLAWMMSMDSNYENDDLVVTDFNGDYRLVRVNCNVDVNVYDSHNNLVASIENEVTGVTDGGIAVLIDDDGQKTVYLPVTEDYNIEITARKSDTVNYGISEYCAPINDKLRNVNYFDVQLDEGETLKSILPAYTEDEINYLILDGSTVDYQLYDPDDNLIIPDSDLRGSYSMDAVYNVIVSVDDETHGAAMGGGFRQYGSFANVEAVASNGYQFIGWYENEECVSTEPSYRFCVKNDVTLVAKFQVVKNNNNIGPQSPANTESLENPPTGSDEGYIGVLMIFSVIGCIIIRKKRN